MSNVITIPKAMTAEKYDPKDYETILQISDDDPKTENGTLNTDAVKFWDDDLEKMVTTDTCSYAYKEKHITNTYTYNITEIDNTSTYLNYPDMKDMTRSGSAGNYSYGSLTATKDCWHITYPTEQTYYNVNIERLSNTTLHILDYDTGAKVEDKSSTWYRIGNGSLTGLNMWQTMKNASCADEFETQRTRSTQR